MTSLVRGTRLNSPPFYDEKPSKEILLIANITFSKNVENMSENKCWLKLMCDLYFDVLEPWPFDLVLCSLGIGIII